MTGTINILETYYLNEKGGKGGEPNAPSDSGGVPKKRGRKTKNQYKSIFATLSELDALYQYSLGKE